MIQTKVFQMMNAAKERIIKTMQERGIKKVNLVMTWEEWAKENGFDPAEDPDYDYYDYRNQEAPYVISFNKWGYGVDYAAYSVELVEGPVNPRFKLECYNSGGSDWFYDSDLTYFSMIGVYDAMEAELEIEEVEKQTVYVVTFLNDCEWELPNVSVNVFGTLEKARECLDKEWQTLAAEHEYDEDVSKKNDDDFLFEDSCANRTIGEIRTLTIN